MDNELDWLKDLLTKLFDKYTCPMCEREVGYLVGLCWHCGKKLYWED